VADLLSFGHRLRVDYNTSVFDSRFSDPGYKNYLGQIGYVPGMAAHVRAAFSQYR
jgi:hypothetical protein